MQLLYHKATQRILFCRAKKGKWRRRQIFFKGADLGGAELFFFFVPQCRQGLPKCANAMHFATTVVASTCSTARRRFPRRLQSHAPYCIIIYSVVREVKGTRPKEAGWRLFLFIMAWYRTPGQSASYSQPHGARPDPPDFFP